MTSIASDGSLLAALQANPLFASTSLAQTLAPTFRYQGLTEVFDSFIGVRCS